jgi:hypothetical protein
LQALLKWLIHTVLLDWLFEKIKELVASHQAKKKKEEEAVKNNDEAEAKLEKAETEQDVIDAGKDLLGR